MYSSDICFSISVPSRVQYILHPYGSCSHDNKLDCVIDYITDNRLDSVGITETWHSNDNKNNMSVVNTCLDNCYTIHHGSRNTSRRVGYLSSTSR